MKATIRKNRTLVSKMGKGIPSVWVDNQKFWPQALQRVANNYQNNYQHSAADLSSVEMSGNIIAVGPKALSFVAEIPAGFRTVEVHNESKSDIDPDSRGGESIRTIFVPKMIVGAVFNAAHRLTQVYAFFINCPDGLEFSDKEYLQQQLYEVAFQNFWRGGRMCNSSRDYKAPYPTIASMLNTVIESIFGSTFNADMGSTLGHGVKERPLAGVNTIAEMYQKWEAMSPNEVMKMEWYPADHYGTLRSLIIALGISVIPTQPNSSAYERPNFKLVSSSMGSVAQSLAVKER